MTRESQKVDDQLRQMERNIFPRSVIDDEEESEMNYSQADDINVERVQPLHADFQSQKI